jgi:hypothetical protein
MLSKNTKISLLKAVNCVSGHFLKAFFRHAGAASFKESKDMAHLEINLGAKFTN